MTWLSILAVIIAAIVKVSSAGVSLLDAVGLFLGLEGTIFIAFALSPSSYRETSERPGLINWIEGWKKEGRELAYPIHHNPILFHLGLGLIAASMVTGSIVK